MNPERATDDLAGDKDNLREASTDVYQQEHDVTGEISSVSTELVSDNTESLQQVHVPKEQITGSCPIAHDNLHTPNRNREDNAVRIEQPAIIMPIINNMRPIEALDQQSTAPAPSQVKKPTSRKLLTQSTSVVYAIFIVTLGNIMFVSVASVNASSVFCLYLVVVGFVYVLFLIVDIEIYLKNVRNQKRREINSENYTLMGQQNGQLTGIIDYTIPENDLKIEKPVWHKYCRSRGRHAGSFYLKLGASAFAFGHMVHLLLLLTIQLDFLLDVNYRECFEYWRLMFDCIYPTYSIVQLFFVFKYSNIIILRRPALARFGIMHLIGSSICLWIWAIVRETTLVVSSSIKHGYQNSTIDAPGTKGAKGSFYLSELLQQKCSYHPAINKIFTNFSPYLFPFSVEYNILIVGIFYIMWHNIGNCNGFDDYDAGMTNNEERSNPPSPVAVEGEMVSLRSGEPEHAARIELRQRPCSMGIPNEANGYSSNFVIHADCHSSSRGIFGGIVIAILTVVFVIIGFILGNIDNPEFSDASYIVSDVSKLFLNVVMLLAVVVAYCKTSKLDINPHPVSLLDDILLYICLPAFFMDTIFTMFATISITNVVKCLNAAVMSIQVIIQTPFLVDGLRRCSNSRRLRRSKPGRELVMFLLFVNVAMWIFNTFSYKSPDSMDERYEYYGKIQWKILSHISLPLIMFYRFHSSVCLADIWKSAYEPGEGH